MAGQTFLALGRCFTSHCLDRDRDLPASREGFLSSNNVYRACFERPLDPDQHRQSSANLEHSMYPPSLHPACRRAAASPRAVADTKQRLLLADMGLGASDGQGPQQEGQWGCVRIGVGWQIETKERQQHPHRGPGPGVDGEADKEGRGPWAPRNGLPRQDEDPCSWVGREAERQAAWLEAISSKLLRYEVRSMHEHVKSCATHMPRQKPPRWKRQQGRATATATAMTC